MRDRAVSIPAYKPGTPQFDRLFRTLVELLEDYAIMVLDPEGYIATWNRGAERIKGYRPAEIIGRHFSLFYTAEDNAAGKPAMELEVAAATGRYEDEGWRIRKDGVRFWANVVITRLKDETGKLIGFGKVTRDLTERRIAEQRYRLLIEGVTDYAIYSLDPAGHITTWNAGAELIKGYSTSEIIGRHFSTFFTPEDVETGLPQQLMAEAEKHGHIAAEGWRVRKDGSRLWSSIVLTAVRNDQGELTGFTKITRDMTDRKNLLDQINRHAHELEIRVAERERTNAELEAFSYSVSHDLRAPLRAVEGFSQALREEYGHLLDETGLDYLTQVTDAAARMNRLVKDLLDYSRLSRTDLASSPVSVREALRRACEELSPVEHSHISIRVPGGMRVMAHEPTLVQMLMNLITNALKFHAKGSKPRVQVEAAVVGENWVRISVEDNGIGIAPEHQVRIFEVFERLHGIEAFPGTGIGLAIIKRGAERMGGRYGLQSALGKGSTFWIELPLASEHA